MGLRHLPSAGTVLVHYLRQWLNITLILGEGIVVGAVVKAACLKNRRSRIRAPPWHSFSKKRNVSSPLTRN